MNRAGARREAGQTTVLLVGLFVVVATLVAVVVDASAAYLRRQQLLALADSAALAAADGVRGEVVYTEGLGGPGDTVTVDPGTARSLVAAHLAATGAPTRWPGLTWAVEVVGDEVRVQVRAPLDLPLGVPGVGDGVLVDGSATAVVVLQ